MLLVATLLTCVYEREKEPGVVGCRSKVDPFALLFMVFLFLSAQDGRHLSKRKKYTTLPQFLFVMNSCNTLSVVCTICFMSSVMWKDLTVYRSFVWILYGGQLPRSLEP